MPRAHSRWTDDPFWQPETPEQKEWIRKRDHAINLFRKTGDIRPAIEIDLFSKSDNTHEKRFTPPTVTCECGRQIRPPDLKVSFNPERGLQLE